MGLMATTNLFLINLMKFIVDMVSPEKLRRCFKIAEMIYRVELLSCGSRVRVAPGSRYTGLWKGEGDLPKTSD